MTLAEWERRWPRWFGGPDDVAAIARKIEHDMHHSFGDTVKLFVDLGWGTPKRSTTSHDPEALADDLRVNRSSLDHARLRILAIARDAPYPIDIDQWPTKRFSMPSTGFAAESMAAPALVQVELTAWAGASLVVACASGLGGDRLFKNTEPYVNAGAGTLPAEPLYRGIITWLVPRFELTVGRRRWVSVVSVFASGIAFVGGLAGIAALLIS